jgi:DNA adenine methylase
MTPPLKWHGGKHYLAPKIVALMSPHTHYVEPYAGGLSVMLAKEPEGVSEVANDINEHLTNFWEVLRHPNRFVAFRVMCEATPFSERAYGMASAQLHDLSDDPVRAAWSFFVRCRQSLAGRMKSFAPLSRTRTRRGMNEQVSAWINAVDGLPEVHARLRRVAILNHDALEVIRQQDGPQTLFYCDPPYLHETRKATDVYEHEMTRGQHEQLLSILAGVKGKWMLSGYRSGLYDMMASQNNWTRHDFDLPNNSAGGDTKRRMTECVWCNF